MSGWFLGASRKFCLISTSEKRLLKAKTLLESHHSKINKMPSRTSLSTTSTWNGHAPSRSADGTFHFQDFPLFLPNRSPKEILQAGSFGGTYFRPIKSAVCPRVKFGDEVWKELPEDWIDGLDPITHLCSSTYRPSVNKYGVKCGASLEEWEQSGWIRPQDPYGWFQWYCRFFQGRRTEDDARQVARWIACAGDKSGRWRNRLCSVVFQQGKEFDDHTASPVIRQTLLHWGYELTKADYQAWGRRQGAIQESAASPLSSSSSSSSRKRLMDATSTTSKQSSKKAVDKFPMDAAKASVEDDEEIVSNRHSGAGKGEAKESKKEHPDSSPKKRRRK